MTYVENAKGYPTLIDYDARGLKTRMDDPDMGEWHYAYDNNGNLSTQTDAKQNIITFGYDELNRVLSKSYTIISHPVNDPNYTEATPNVIYVYDQGIKGIGQLYSGTNSNVTTRYNEYDEMGRSVSVTKTITGDQPRTTLTGYDLSGKVTSIIHPDNFTVTNTYYSGTGLLNTVTGTPSVCDAVEYAKCTKYAPTGKIGKITHTYNNTKTEYTYDAKTTRLATLKTSGPAPGNVTIQSKSYTYYEAGDIHTITDKLAAPNIMYTYQYDNLHRLIEETTSDTALPTDADIMTYNYDDAEHINAVTSINYNGTEYGFTYDANGNMKDGWDLTDPNSIVERDITWNADNMPVVVTRGSNTTDLTYDGDGVRAKKVAGGTTTYYISNAYEIKDGVATKYIFAGNMRVAEIEGAASTIFHKDHLGSSTAMTNSAGAKVEGTEYLPFGGQRSHSGTNTTEYLYTDQELDSESGLYNYDARLYDPVIAKFLSIDPMIKDTYDPQSLNPYTYCRNNPLKYTDPNGEIFWFFIGAAVLYAILHDPPEVNAPENNLDKLYEAPTPVETAVKTTKDVSTVIGSRYVLGKIIKGAENIDNIIDDSSGQEPNPESALDSRGYDRPEIETKSEKAVRARDTTNDWDDFLGPDQTNIDPRDGKPDPDRIWSQDGKRSIRYGEHEMNSKPNKSHYHKETWHDDKIENVLQRVQK